MVGILNLQDATLSAAGEGLVPSVLAFCKEDSFAGANMASVFGMQDKYVHVTPLIFTVKI